MLMDRPTKSISWLRAAGVRMAPTVICFALSLYMWRSFKVVDDVHEVTADFALLCLVVLFRALKNLGSAIWPADRTPPARVRARASWSIVLAIGLVIGIRASVHSWPMPERLVKAIHAPVQDEIPAHK